MLFDVSSRVCVNTFVFLGVANRGAPLASCGYTPRSSRATPAGPGCSPRARPACVWPRRRRSPAPGRRRTPQSSAAACRSPGRRRAGRASPRWRCPAASGGTNGRGHAPPAPNSVNGQGLVSSLSWRLADTRRPTTSSETSRTGSVFQSRLFGSNFRKSFSAALTLTLPSAAAIYRNTSAIFRYVWLLYTVNTAGH